MKPEYDISNSNFVYRMTRLDNTGKEGVLKPDSDGWYTICVGALDHASKNVNKNGQNEYYSSMGMEKFFAPGTLFNERIQGGFIKAEYGHPELEPGMNELKFLERNLQIREKNVCCTFGAIWLVPDYIDPLTKEKCVGIFAKIKPSGPYGKFLEKDLLERGLNVCFSIRSLTTRKNIMGKNAKVLHTVITFDYVGEPGITCAEKMVSPSLESVNHAHRLPADVLDVEITPKEAMRIIEKNSNRELSLESGCLTVLKEIVNEYQSNKKTDKLNKSFNW